MQRRQATEREFLMLSYFAVNIALIGALKLPQAFHDRVELDTRTSQFDKGHPVKTLDRQVLSDALRNVKRAVLYACSGVIRTVA